MIKITATGRLTADPTLSQRNNSNVCAFNLASSTIEKDAEGKYTTKFFSCTIWGK